MEGIDSEAPIGQFFSPKPPMTYILESITAENEKIGYNPEIDTNWCHLSVKARLECIKRMDYPDQFQMRYTSNAEKRIVDSQNLKFVQVDLVFSLEFRAVFLKDYDEEELVYEGARGSQEYEKALRNTAQLLKMSTVNSLEVKEGMTTDSPLEEFVRLAPYRFDSLINDHPMRGDWRPELFFMDNCANDLRFFTSHIHFQDFLNVKIPKLFSFHTWYMPRDIVKYIKKWIEEDVEIGTELSCITGTLANLRFFTKALRDRKISLHKKVYRYRTNNDAKELHVKFGRDEDFDRVTMNVEMKAAEPLEPKVQRNRQNSRVKN